MYAPTQAPPPRLLPLGDTALTIEFGDAIDPATAARVLGLDAAIATARTRGDLPAIVECVPTFRSLTVHFDPDHATAGALAAGLLALATTAPPRVASGRRWRIPVCFDADFAPDLDAVAAACGLAPAQVLENLTATEFRCGMLGFLPGFAYLYGVRPPLDLPRRATPRVAVPERSLAIAGGMCAVYPCVSPGGWHLLGRTPVRPFDAEDAAGPALFAPGDAVRWVAIDRTAYEDLDALATARRLPRESLLEAG